MKILNENNLVRIISYGPFIFIPSVIVLISFFVLHVSQLQYETSLKDIETSYTDNQKSRIISKVDIAIKLIEYKKSITEEMLKEKVKNRVDTAYSVAKNLYIQNIKNHKKKDVQKIIIDSLRPLVWNKGESFIFILDFDGVFYLAPKYLKNLEGKSIIDFQDATKRYVIKEEIDLAKTKGEGYLWDTFTRPNYDKNLQFKQLAYIKKFDDFNWYMGSAEYLDTTMAELENSALDILKNTFINESDYFFVIDEDGNNIMNGQNLFKEGANILSLKDVDGKEVVKELIKSANSDEPYFVSYKLKNPKTGMIDQKYSYVRKVPQSNWIVGSGFYDFELHNQIESKRLELKGVYIKEYTKILFLSFFMMLLSLFVSYDISKRLKEKLLEYSKELTEKNDELITLNSSLEYLVEERTAELNEAYSYMKEVAIKDSLTKLYNRYYFNDALENEIHRSDRYDSAFSLCMFDIDDFKNINDTYGHDVGDRVLKSVADIIKEHMRESDIFARVGGEEFMIIFQKTSLYESYSIAQRIRESVEKYDFSQAGQVTISVGLVAYQYGEDKEQLLKRVDKALYEAKNSGKNTVITDPMSHYYHS